MKLKIDWKAFVPHVIAVLVFLTLTLAYFAPVLEGKDVRQADAVGSMGWGKDARDYHEESGEYSYWSNSMFSGMPCNYTFAPQPVNTFKPLSRIVTLNYFGASSRHIGCIFATFIGCYLLFLALGCKSWLSIAGSIVYTLGSYNFIIIAAGHMNKSLVIATLAPIVGGIALCYRRKLILGALLTLLFAGLNIYWSHQQVTYYMMLTALIMAVVYFVYAWREKWLPYYFKATGVLAIVAVMAVAPAVGILMPTNDYAKDSMRGGSELSTAAGGEKTDGLDVDYAFSWSYGKMETMTLLIPNFYGASSHYDVGTDSKLFNAYRTVMLNNYVDVVLQQNPDATEEEAMRYIYTNREIRAQVDAEAKQFVKAAPTYWGDQPFTEGPVYAGAIVCLLFVLGLFILKGAEKWWLLIATIFSIILAWGRNLPGINNFLFEYMPLYNKFRTPSMSLVITTLTMSTMAVLTVKQFVEIAKEKNAEAIKTLRKHLFTSFAIVGGIAFLFHLTGGYLLSFTSPTDAGIVQIPELYDALIAERKALLNHDALRSLGFIAATVLLLSLYLRGKLKKNVFVALLIIFFLVDMWPVSWRFLSHDDFIAKKKTTAIKVTDADRQIKMMAGNDPNYRVFNLTSSPFNEAFTSYKHNSIGGYSPAKLSRYQDIIDRYLSKMNWKVISMLNTRFIITEDGVAENNADYGLPGAFGNCWMVNGINWVDGANEEIAAIENVDKNTAHIDNAWKELVPNAEKYNNNAQGEIMLTEYRNPGNIVYHSRCAEPKMAVFSEVYYKTWKAYIDGEEVKPIRANYVLRALPIPAGEHTIEFKCYDEVMAKSHRLSLYFSLMVGAAIVALVGIYVYRRIKK
ncbi:MAG: hypothetical protein IKV07_00850 [Bacteroidaceae bacterium]|nr:hypothetical protein [Bacteroidaceae bacterium]